MGLDCEIRTERNRMREEVVMGLKKIDDDAKGGLEFNQNQPKQDGLCKESWLAEEGVASIVAESGSGTGIVLVSNMI